MAFDHETELAGRPLVPYEPGQPPGDLSRIGLDVGLFGEDGGEDKDCGPYLEALLAEPWADAIEVISLGWNAYSGTPDMGYLLKVLIQGVRRLPRLTHLLVGNMGQDECEVSWIGQSDDYGPLLAAFPRLETLWIRGMTPTIRCSGHAGLKTLIMQSGGLGGAAVRQIAAADLPALETLELWFGVQNYGGDATLEDVRPILAGDRLPRLRRLALVNLTEDEPGRLAETIPLALADAPILTRLEELDLRGSTPSERVVQALARTPAVRTLPRLRLGYEEFSRNSLRPPPAPVPGLDNVVFEPFVIVSE